MFQGLRHILNGARRELSYFENDIGDREQRWRTFMGKLAAIRNSDSFDYLPGSVRCAITFVHDVLTWTPRDRLSRAMLVVIARQLRILEQSRGDVDFRTVYAAIANAGFNLAPPVE